MNDEFEMIQGVARILGIQAYPDQYTGKDSERPRRWITYNRVTNTGDLFGDDDPGVDVRSVQVHFFLPVRDDYRSMDERIRKELYEAGFTYPETTYLTDGDESSHINEKLRHIVYECETDFEIESQEGE